MYIPPVRCLLPLLLLCACAQSGPNGPQQGDQRRTTKILVSPPSVVASNDIADTDDAFPIPGVPSTGPDGAYEQKDGDQVLIQGEYQGGKPVGVWTGWHRNGQKKVTGALKAGMPVGEWTVWYADGTPREVSRYDDQGRPTGTWTLHYADGSLFEEMEHEAGEPHGTWKIFHPGGTLADDMTWAAGKQVGTETSYDPAGAKLGEGAFAEGAPTGTWTCFDGAEARTIAAPSQPTTPRAACTTQPGPELGPMPGAGPDEQFVTRNPKLEEL